MKYNTILNSQQFKCQISEHLTYLLKRTKSADNEASVAFAFESEIFALVRNLFSIDLNFKKEVNNKTLRHRFKGRMDAICNNLLIEYKHQSRLSTKKNKLAAEKQLVNYIEQLYSEDGTEYFGVLTDGIQIKYLYYQNSNLHISPFKNIDQSDLDRLVRSLIDVENKKFVPQNIVKDFKLEAPNQVTKRLASYLYDSLVNQNSIKASMLFQEWKVLFHLSENDRGQNKDIIKRRKALNSIFSISINDNQNDYKALFALQTTYAIIVKLIACKVVTKIEFNKDIEYFSDLTALESETLRNLLEYIEDGYVFQTGGVRNLLEGDFFSWYCCEDIWTERQSNIILELINILQNYTHNYYIHGYNTIDIFIDLYMEIMPREVRHSLGEYFTPAWLADQVVKNGISKIKTKEFNIVDPCCGSGVFLMAILKNIVNFNDVFSLNDVDRKKILNGILQRVKGIDINPLSVLTAKVSFYLSIKPLIKGDDIEIPVYLGDSANIPVKVMLDNILCYQYDILTKQETINVILPCDFVENENFFYAMSQLQALIKTEEDSFVVDQFISYMPKYKNNQSVINVLKTLANQLINLHKNKWDGIWIRIVANFMLVARIKNIDIIVGNPPWVKWEFLPQEYAKKIKTLCIDRHLFSNQKYLGAINLNICALIANVTASTWLNDDGVLAFLMPKTMLTQDSYSGFRNFYTKPDRSQKMFLEYLDDWTKAGHPFIDTTEKFMTYYYSKKKIDYFKDGVPVREYKKKIKKSIVTINSKQTFDEVVDNFEITEKAKAFQFDKKRTGFTILNEEYLNDKNNFALIIGECAYKARSGVEFTPAEIYFITPKDSIANSSSYLFVPTSLNHVRHRSLDKLPFQIETKYVRPVIKAPNIRPFKIVESDNYCIYPYEWNEIVSVAPEQLIKKSEKLFNYLSRNKKVIEAQSKKSIQILKGKAYYSLSKIGFYTYAPFKVTFRDNTILNAAVVKNIVTPWNTLVEPICAKHSAYISQDKSGRLISEDEAYFICAILNSPIVKKYFKFTFSERAYTINFNIKIPLYDNTCKVHSKLVKIAKKAEMGGVTNQINRSLDENYLALCKNIR